MASANKDPPLPAMMVLIARQTPATTKLVAVFISQIIRSVREDRYVIQKQVVTNRSAPLRLIVMMASSVTEVNTVKQDSVNLVHPPIVMMAMSAPRIHFQEAQRTAMQAAITRKFHSV